MSIEKFTVLVQSIAAISFCVTAIWLRIQRDQALAKADRLYCDLDEIRFVAGTLIRSLPKCDQCEKPATRAWKRGAERWCDEHGQLSGVSEYPRARPLRALIRVLSVETKR
jgi:hypothetical protein